MTREAVNKELETITSTVTRNRLAAILSVCKTVDEFARLTETEALMRYRETALGKKSHHDLGPITYTALSAIQANVRQSIREEKSAERAAQRAELWFSRDDITLAASFMDTWKLAKIELGQIRSLLDSVVRDEPDRPEKKESAS